MAIRIEELNGKFAEFEDYMTYNRWDTCCAEGIYSDDGIRAVSMFLEFCDTGKVIDDEGRELKA